MQITLNPEDQRYIEEQVRAGRYRRLKISSQRRSRACGRQKIPVISRPVNSTR